MTQGDRIKELRKNLNLTLEKFGARIGVGKSTISDIENNRRSLTDHMMKSICREYNVSYEWITTGGGEMFEPSASDELDALAKRYSLSHDMRVLIGKLVELDEPYRQAVVDFMVDFARKLREEDAQEQDGQDDIDREVEDYRRQLREEKESGGKSRVSPRDA